MFRPNELVNLAVEDHGEIRVILNRDGCRVQLTSSKWAEDLMIDDVRRNAIEYVLEVMQHAPDNGCAHWPTMGNRARNVNRRNCYNPNVKPGWRNWQTHGT
jgi:hypothetical protein